MGLSQLEASCTSTGSTSIGSTFLWFLSDHWSTPNKWILIGSTEMCPLHKIVEVYTEMWKLVKMYKRKRKQNKISSLTLQLSNCLLLFYKLIFSNSGLKHFANSSEDNSKSD